MNISISKIVLVFFLIVSIVGCKKQIVNEYVVDDVHVSSETGNKANLKSDLQLITIMYADVFGTSISSEKLKGLNQAYVSFGDKDIVIDRITHYFLSDAAAQIPSDNYMRFNPDQFITEAYKKFFVRNPSEAELWYLKKVINESSSLAARDIYYAILTSEEYKYY
jgi:hypothetical protein